MLYSKVVIQIEHNMENVLALLAMKFHVLIRAIYSFPLNYQVLYFRPKCYRLLFFRERAATCYAELHTQSSTPCDIGEKTRTFTDFSAHRKAGLCIQHHSCYRRAYSKQWYQLLIHRNVLLCNEVFCLYYSSEYIRVVYDNRLCCGGKDFCAHWTGF